MTEQSTVAITSELGNIPSSLSVVTRPGSLRIFLCIFANPFNYDQKYTVSHLHRNSTESNQYEFYYRFIGNTISEALLKAEQNSEKKYTNIWFWGSWVHVSGLLLTVPNMGVCFYKFSVTDSFNCLLKYILENQVAYSGSV